MKDDICQQRVGAVVELLSPLLEVRKKKGKKKKDDIWPKFWYNSAQWFSYEVHSLLLMFPFSKKIMRWLCIDAGLTYFYAIVT